MSLFDKRPLPPMLIGAEGEAFDSPDYLYELKLDGIRCLAYLSPSGSVELVNKRSVIVTGIYPELRSIAMQIKGQCVLDGEITVFSDGKPDFSEIRRRSLMSNPFKIRIAADQLPVNYTAFDILHYKGEDLISRPLEERKDILSSAVTDSPRLAVSRIIEEHGTALYGLTVQHGLEGIVAKRKGSLYFPGKRTKDWIKCKNLQDDDFVVCGYIRKEKGVVSLVLGQYQDGRMIYQGHVTLGVSSSDFRRIEALPERKRPPFDIPPGNEYAVWVRPKLVCTVAYMERTASGSMRQPVCKGLRDDKSPEECQFIQK